MKDFIFALDVDGVLTDGKFHWDANGNKVYKEFGPDDADALKLIKPYLKRIILYTQDKKGLGISVSRATHMGLEIMEANTKGRLEDIQKFYGFENTVYMGDSFLDVPILAACHYGITTSDADPYAKEYSNYITTRAGGNRAVSEAVFWIFKNILKVQKVKLFEGYELTL